MFNLVTKNINNIIKKKLLFLNKILINYLLNF